MDAYNIRSMIIDGNKPDHKKKVSIIVLGFHVRKFDM